MTRIVGLYICVCSVRACVCNNATILGVVCTVQHNAKNGKSQMLSSAFIYFDSKNGHCKWLMQSHNSGERLHNSYYTATSMRANDEWIDDNVRFYGKA